MMEMKPSYDIKDVGEELEVGFFVDEFKVAFAIIPLEIGDEQALGLARCFGEAFIASVRPRSAGFS